MPSQRKPIQNVKFGSVESDILMIYFQQNLG